MPAKCAACIVVMFIGINNIVIHPKLMFFQQRINHSRYLPMNKWHLDSHSCCQFSGMLWFLVGGVMPSNGLAFRISEQTFIVHI